MKHSARAGRSKAFRGVSLLGALFCIFAPWLHAAFFQVVPPALLIIEGGTLIDGNGGPPIRDVQIAIEGNRIASIGRKGQNRQANAPVSYTHLRAHETPEHLVCCLLLEKKK